MTIVSNLWIDAIRKETHISHSHKPNEEQKGKNVSRVILQSSLSVPLDEMLESKENIAMPEIKEHRKKEFCNLPAEMRIVIKMWMPYLWNYCFEADEEEILINKYGLQIESLRDVLKEETIKIIEKNKAYISASIIAMILKLSRDCVDQMICRAKKRLPWLGNLRHELE